MRRTIFADHFTDLADGIWSHRDLDYSASRPYAKGDERGVVIGPEGLELSILPTDKAPDGTQRFGYGHIGMQGDPLDILPGDHVNALIKWAPFRGGHGSLWTQGKQAYGTPADYEADIEHYGAKNPWRLEGVNLATAVHWRAAGQPFGQYTSVKVDRRSADFLPPRTPWSDAFHKYQIRVHHDGFSFRVDGALLSRIRTEHTPRAMFVCLSMITRQFEYEDLLDAFEADPDFGPGVMFVRRLWVTRPG